MVVQDLSKSGDGFAVEVVHSDGIMTVKISGELDTANVSLLRDQIARAIDDEPAAVLVDLAELEFCDPSGISVLILACKRIRANGGTFALAHLQPSIRRAFESTGVAEYLSERS
jgi:anti-sigma B factor antagonist